MTITALIDKEDTFEIVRNQIAAILAAETISQQALAVIAGEEPEEWRFRVFIERSNAWQMIKPSTDDKVPIVNVWWDSSTFEQAGSNTFERQKAIGTFNIDCYGFGFARTDGGTGHISGDKDAALNAQRAVRLVRNILMAAENRYLQLDTNFCWFRFPGAISSFQLTQDLNAAPQVNAIRFALDVKFSEFAPQFDLATLEVIHIDVSEDGSIILEAEYDYTT